MTFSNNCYEISHTDSTNIIRAHNIGYLRSKCGFWTQIVLSLKTTGLYRNCSNWFIKHSLKRVRSVHFLHFIGIVYLNYKEIRGSGARRFDKWIHLIIFGGNYLAYIENYISISKKDEPTKSWINWTNIMTCVVIFYGGYVLHNYCGMKQTVFLLSLRYLWHTRTFWYCVRLSGQYDEETQWCQVTL